MTTRCKKHSLQCFGLDKGYLDLGKFTRATEHFQRCVENLT